LEQISILYPWFVFEHWSLLGRPPGSRSGAPMNGASEVNWVVSGPNASAVIIIVGFISFGTLYVGTRDLGRRKCIHLQPIHEN
jgi:hypothetical protein